jgi:hypothetical protein
MVLPFYPWLIFLVRWCDNDSIHSSQSTVTYNNLPSISQFPSLLDRPSRHNSLSLKGTHKAFFELELPCRLVHTWRWPMPSRVFFFYIYRAEYFHITGCESIGHPRVQRRLCPEARLATAAGQSHRLMASRGCRRRSLTLNPLAPSNRILPALSASQDRLVKQISSPCNLQSRQLVKNTYIVKLILSENVKGRGIVSSCTP